MDQKLASPEPKRRWWQFGLWTLLIWMAMFGTACAYIAHEARIVAKRDAALQRLQSEEADGRITITRGTPFARPIPWVRRILGDQAIDVFYMSPDAALEERRRVGALFPEATILREEPDGSESLPQRFPAE
jgi:hypothetical protein